jgi:hypothetical protein
VERQQLETDVSAKFVSTDYTVSASSAAGGTINPMGAVAVAPASSQGFTISPLSGYSISAVTVDGVSQGAVDSYTFSNVAANHTISATFTDIVVTPGIALARHAGTVSATTYGDALGFDVTVSGTPIPTGTVALLDGGTNGTVIGSGSLAGGTCTITPAINALAVGGHDNLVAVYSGDGNFPSMTSGALDAQTVSPKALTVTGAAVASKTYDGTTAATLTAGSLSGVLGSDAITLGNATSGTFADPDAGTAKPVSAAMSVSGAAAANYLLTQPALTGDIIPRVVTLGGGRTYDGTSSVAAGDLSLGNNLDGADLTLVGSATLIDRNVGPQTLATSYTTPTRVRSATGFSTGTTSTSFVVTMGAAPARSNTLVAVISTRGSTASRVTSISQTGATWTRAAQSTNSNGSTTEIWVAAVGDSAGTGVTIRTAAGRCAAVVIEYSGVLTAGSPVDQINSTDSSGNSNSPLTGTTAATTQAAEVWIGGIGYRASEPTLSATLNSFTAVQSAQSGSTTSANNAKVYALERMVSATGAAGSGGTLTATVQWSGAIATFKAASTSSLTLAGPAARNYSLSGTTGTVQITPKVLTVNGLLATSREYDGGPAANLTGTAALLPAVAAGSGTPGDGMPYIGDAVTLAGTATGAFADKHAGSLKPVAVSGMTLAGAQAGNYTLTQPAGLTANVTPLPLTVAALSATKTYDGTTSAAGTPNLTPPLAAGDTTSDLAQAYLDENAGEGDKVVIPNITIDDGNGGANYAVTLLRSNTGTIHKAVATVALDNLAHAYDGTPKAATASTDPAGLAVDLTYDGSPAAPSAAGTYAVVASVTEANYTGMASATLVIAADAFASWRASHFTPEEIAAGLAANDADPDGDGRHNLAEFAFDGDPRNAASSGWFVTRLAAGDADAGAPELAYTCATRRGAVFSANPNNAQQSLLIDGLVYTIEASSTLTGAWDGVVSHQGASDTAPPGSGLPDLTGSAWQYHTFSAFNGVVGSGFLRAGVAQLVTERAGKPGLAD